MTAAEDVRAVVAEAHRREWARVLAATVCLARSLDLAEECVQEAYASALETWVRSGIPRNPAAWLTTAKRCAIDAIRRDETMRARLPLLGMPEETAGEVAVQELADEDAGDPGDAVPDGRLRLIFTCCHRALAQQAQVALTLRLVCGVPTPDIARLFLVPEPTMGARAGVRLGANEAERAFLAEKIADHTLPA